jgi:predicted Zn-dependent peptidase
LYDGDPKLVNTELEELLSVTPDQISSTVNKYLNTENRALLDVIPAAAKAN